MESDNERQSRVGDEPIAKCCFWIVVTTAVVTLVMLIAILLVGYPLQLPLR
jgi:hypothetical protein